jgi:predicted metalloenzyme YecM
MNTRFKNVSWPLPTEKDGRIQSWEAVQIAILMDIRDELQRLNSLLHCHNFTGIPATLRGISKKLATPRKPK